MTSDTRIWLCNMISEFVKNSPENSLMMETEEKAWEDNVLIGFSSGSDRLYEDYKNLVGELHWTPHEIFTLTFPDAAVNPADLSVISWVLLQRETTKADNRQENFYPSRRWIHARFPGEEFNNSLRRHIVRELSKIGIKAVAPVITPQWSWEKSPKYVFTSRWSERHAAYAAGLGTFGLCDGLITVKGKAHRVGSVVANLAVPATTRPYENHHAYCLFFFDGSCTGCRKRCPVGAISEKGHDKLKCWDHAVLICGNYVKENYGFDGYGCGLCQTAVPCESGIPRKIRKRLDELSS